MRERKRTGLGKISKLKAQTKIKASRSKVGWLVSCIFHARTDVSLSNRGLSEVAPDALLDGPF